MTIARGAKDAATTPRRAFTLIELIVVLAIILMLAGLLFPCIGMIKRAAVATACGNNLRQVGMATLCYADDNLGQFPAEGNWGINDPARSPAWFFRLPPYIDDVNVAKRTTVFQCAGYRKHAAQILENASPKSFKMNGYLDDEGRPRHYTLGSVSDESALVLFIDGIAKETGMGQWGYALCTAVDDSRHRGRVNVLFCDGHSSNRVVPGQNCNWKTRLKWRSNDWGPAQ
jgi:prepilin-type processing-associated H-X9-DG protein/prepilin-type N-terminal cleavage/methylation domain-containing protein